MSDYIDLGAISLKLKVPLKILIFTPMPDDAAVKEFIRIFRRDINNPGIIVAQLEARSVSECFALSGKLPEFSLLLFVTHGDSNGQPCYDGQLPQPLFTWASISSWFMGAIDNKFVMLAVCNAGIGQYTHDLLHDGQALHVVTPVEGTELPVIKGAESMAALCNKLDKPRDIPPEEVEYLFDEIESKFPKVLDLWPYRGGGTPVKYTPKTRK